MVGVGNQLRGRPSLGRQCCVAYRREIAILMYGELRTTHVAHALLLLERLFLRDMRGLLGCNLLETLLSLLRVVSHDAEVCFQVLTQVGLVEERQG